MRSWWKLGLVSFVGLCVVGALAGAAYRHHRASLRYDFENDPIAAAFYEQVPPLAETLLKRWDKSRLYRTSDFPLSPERHARFKARIRATIQNGMNDPSTGSGGAFWMVPANEAKRSHVLDGITVHPVKVVEIEGQAIELSTIEIKATGDVVPYAACFPAKPQPVPGVFVSSGHTMNGLRDVFIDRDEYQHAVALRLCKAGFATASIEKIDSGILSTAFQYLGHKWGKSGDPPTTDEDAAATTALGTGDYSVAARQLIASVAAVEYFASDRRVDERNIGATGVSFGGWLSVLTALANGRIKAIANWGGTWIMLENYLENPREAPYRGIFDYSMLFPGIFKLGDRNRFMFAVAPIPMLTGYGTKPDDFTRFRSSYFPLIQKQYEALGAGGNIKVVQFKGGHEANYADTLAYFRMVLQSSPPAGGEKRPNF